MKIKQETIEEVNKIAPEDLESRGVVQRANDGKSYVCPICKNGTHTPKSSGITPNFVNGAWLWHCFSCHTGFNNMKILGLYYGLDPKADFSTLIENISNDFFIQIQYEGNSNFSTTRPARKNKENNYVQPVRQIKEPTAEEKAQEEQLKKLIADDIKRAQENLIPFMEENVPDGIKGTIRGLSLPISLKDFGCGVLLDWTHPKNRIEGKKVTPTRRFIIPTGKYHYNAVAFDEDRAFIQKPYWKMHAGKMLEPFGMKTLTADTEQVLIFEGEIDAMSAWQAYQEQKFLYDSMKIFSFNGCIHRETGALKHFDEISTLPPSAFLATFGAANTNWIDAFDSKCKQLKITPRVIVMFDDDDAGHKNAPKHREKLIKLGYPAVIKFL